MEKRLFLILAGLMNRSHLGKMNILSWVITGITVLTAGILQRGLRLQPEIELASHNLLISLARIGLGVAGVTEELSLSGLNRGVVRKLHLAEEIPSRRVVLCTRRNTPPSAAAGRFMEMIRANHGFDRPAEQDG